MTDQVHCVLFGLKTRRNEVAVQYSLYPERGIRHAKVTQAVRNTYNGRFENYDRCLEDENDATANLTGNVGIDIMMTSRQGQVSCHCLQLYVVCAVHRYSSVYCRHSFRPHRRQYLIENNGLTSVGVDLFLRSPGGRLAAGFLYKRAPRRQILIQFDSRSQNDDTFTDIDRRHRLLCRSHFVCNATSVDRRRWRRRWRRRRGRRQL